MDAKTMNRYKNKLLLLKQELLKNVQRNQSSGKETRDDLKDLADQASDAYEKEFLFGLSDSERKLLSEVEAALYKIEEGTFGRCEECGEMINSERLEALSYAHLCLSCQSAKEKRRAAF